MSRDDADVAAFVPLSEKECQILFAFSGGALHGYGVVRAVEERTGGVVRLEPANLYRKIQRFVEAGLVAEAEAPAVEEDDRRRRYYELTGLGRRVLAHELGRWEALVAEAARRGLAG